MRNRVYWNSLQARFFSGLILLGLLSLAIAGCGGGSGGSTPAIPPPGTTNVAVIGTVKDTSNVHNPVAGAVVTIVGTSLSVRTDASGTFTFSSVPSTVTQFTVSNPDPTSYFSYANYNSKFYDIVKCTFLLPALHTGTNTVTEVDLFLGGSSPPPPPPTGGCP